MAQVVGSGAIADEALGNSDAQVTVLATAAKMMRISALPVLVFVAGYIFRQPGQNGAKSAMVFADVRYSGSLAQYAAVG